MISPGLPWPGISRGLKELSTPCYVLASRRLSAHHSFDNRPYIAYVRPMREQRACYIRMMVLGQSPEAGPLP